MVEVTDGMVELACEVMRLREELEQCQLSGTAAYVEMEAELHTDELRDEIEGLRKVLVTMLLERLKTLEATEDALSRCGLTGIYDVFDSPADAILQMAGYIAELEQ